MMWWGRKREVGVGDVVDERWDGRCTIAGKASNDTVGAFCEVFGGYP